ncbi:hypothetical protein IJ531_06195, partial [bacterium]|nr:hypothetical protein [bacterium]
MGQENVSGFGAITHIMQGLQKNTDFNVRSQNDESVINIFDSMNKVMESNNSAVGEEDIFSLLDGKFDLNETQELMNAINDVASLDGNMGVSYEDFGLFEASYNILSNVYDDSHEVSADEIKSIAEILTSNNQGLTADELVSAVKSKLNLDDSFNSAELTQLLNNIAAKSIDGAGADKIDAQDLLLMGKEAMQAYLNSETSREDVKATLKPLEEGTLPQDSFRGARNDEVMHDANGEGYWVVTDFWNGNENNNASMNTLDIVINNIYGDVDGATKAALSTEIRSLADNEGFFNGSGSMLHGDALKLVELNSDFYARHPELTPREPVVTAEPEPEEPVDKHSAVYNE